ncbi:MAG: transcription antitermination factor NusB [Eubacterium sp.]|nr:transcription antitermination factor NusB [Eubacterium sp.]
MKRTEEREQAFYLIFQSLFSGNPSEAVELFDEAMEQPVSEYAKAIYNGATEKADKLDEIISKYLNGWKLNRISKTNLAILRLAVYEIKYAEDVPPAVAINEAVELAKTYSGKEDASFVNGVLGAFVRGNE